MTANVLVLETYADRYAGPLRERFPEISVYASPTIDDADVALSEIDALIAFGIAVDDDVLRGASRLKWIQCLATGVDHFLRMPSLRSEILLTSARGIHGPAMRETVAFLMLSLSRDAPRLFRQQSAHAWDRSQPWPLLCGRTAVLVGVGVSGTAVGQMLDALGMTVVGVSRTPRDISGFDRIVPFEALKDVAAEADFLVNILPGGEQNAHAIDATVFDAMKPTAYFVNVGRGETVDEVAMISALDNNRIAGAGLDVFATEPLPADSPIWDLPNVIVLPHIGGFFSEYEDYAMPIVLDNMRLFLAGRHNDMRNLIAH